MRIYVAGRFEEKASVKVIQNMLREAGHTITFDWTNEDSSGKSGKARIDYLKLQALSDELGVQACDVFVLLHDDNCRGGFIELGMALAYEKIVIVICGRNRPHPVIFYHDPSIHHFDTIESAVCWIHDLKGT